MSLAERLSQSSLAVSLLPSVSKRRGGEVTARILYAGVILFRRTREKEKEIVIKREERRRETENARGRKLD